MSTAVTRRVPPLVVTVAVVLLLLAVPALVAYSVPPLVTADRVLDVYRLAYAGTAAEEAANALSAGYTRSFSVALLTVALVLAVAVIPILFAKHPARVVVWLLGMLTVCGSGPVLLLEPDPPPRPPGSMPQAEVEQLLEAAFPTWLELTSVAAGAVSVVTLFAAMILLGTPPANDFFRKPAPVVPPPPPLHPS